MYPPLITANANVTPGHLSHTKAVLVAFSSSPSQDEDFNVKHARVLFKCCFVQVSKHPSFGVIHFTQSKGDSTRKTEGDMAKDPLAELRCNIEEMYPPYPIYISLWVPTSDLPHPSWSPLSLLALEELHPATCQGNIPFLGQKNADSCSSARTRTHVNSISVLRPNLFILTGIQKQKMAKVWDRFVPVSDILS